MAAELLPAAPPAARTVLADGRELRYGHSLIMGIINATDDSFFDGSRARSAQEAVAAAEKMLAGGAELLDVGGESTRPGSAEVDEKTETARVCPAIEAIKKRFPSAVVSVDTYRAGTARAALGCGADIINDIGALSRGEEMAELAASSGAPVVLMHNRAHLRGGAGGSDYSDVVAEVRDYLVSRADFALSRGIAREKIILDPGLCFSKTPEQNMLVLRGIGEFFKPGYPVLVGHSRKTFIGLFLGEGKTPVPPQGRLEGTLAVTAYLAARGAHIIRVHDVKENAAAARIGGFLWR